MHEVVFSAKGEYTGSIMSWCEVQGIGYNFSKGNYVMKLNDSEWLAFLDFLLNAPEMAGEEEIDVV